MADGWSSGNTLKLPSWNHIGTLPKYLKYQKHLSEIIIQVVRIKSRPSGKPQTFLSDNYQKCMLTCSIG